MQCYFVFVFRGIIFTIIINITLLLLPIISLLDIEKQIKCSWYFTQHFPNSYNNIII